MRGASVWTLSMRGASVWTLSMRVLH
jgi:hypothetical protein